MRRLLGRIECLLQGHQWFIVGDWRTQAGFGGPASDADPRVPPVPGGGFCHDARFTYAGSDIRVECARCQAHAHAELRQPCEREAWRSGRAAEWEMVVKSGLRAGQPVMDAPSADDIARVVTPRSSHWTAVRS